MTYSLAGFAPYSSAMPKPIDPKTSDDFSRRIRAFVEEALEQKGWGQKRLAAEMGISPSMMNKLLLGKSEWTFKYLRSAGKALEILDSQLYHVGSGTPVQDIRTLAGKSEVARTLPPGLSKFLGEHGDDVSKRERVWLESVLDFTGEPAQEPERFWHKLWRVFRQREPSGD